MKNTNNSGKTVGTVMLIVSIMLGTRNADNLSLGVFAIFMLFISIAILRGSKNKSDDNRQIRSGNISAMQSQDVYIRAGDDTKYSYSANNNKNTKIRYKEGNPNECPICREHSENGYCRTCGFRFDK